MIHLYKKEDGSYREAVNKVFTALKGKTPEEIADELNTYKDFSDYYPRNNILSYWKATNPVIPPIGSYFLRYSYDELVLTPAEDRNETITLLEQFDEFEKDLNAFVTKKNKYQEYNVAFKRGFLLYGPPGNGKTTNIRKIIGKYKNAMIFYCNSIPQNTAVDYFNHHFPDVMKIYLFEEIVTQAKESPKRLLDFLDGSCNLQNAVIIATTNYPEELPANLVDRPSRFDKLYKFDHPSAKDRAKIIEFFMKRTPTQEEIDLTKDFSIAHIKEICWYTILHETTFAESLKVSKKHSNLVKKNFKESTKMGFGMGPED